MPDKRGTLTVFAGPMFSGKSEALLARIKRARYARKIVLVVKPHIDNRTAGEIASRELNEEGKFKKSSSAPAEIVANPAQLMELVSKTGCDVIAVDEAQFFEPWFVGLAHYLVWELGKDIIVSGLDLDAWRKPFGIMPQLLAMADKVHKMNAHCFQCGAEARFTQKLAGGQSQIEVGDADKYEARCAECFEEFR